LHWKSKLFRGIFLIAFIAIFTFILIFLLDRNNKIESVDQFDQKEAIQTNDNNSLIDYTKLEAVLNDIPEFYTTFFDPTVSSRLNDLLEDVKANEKTMTQEMVDAYAKEIQEIINSSYSLTGVPQVYIKVSNNVLINKEYSSASIAIVDSKGGKSKDIIDLSAQIKIRGNSTAELEKKSYTIKFLKNEDVLGMGEAKKWCLNANALDKSLMRNKLIFDFASTIGLENTPNSTYADVWLNGKFIGNYLLSELIEASPSRVNINTDKGDFLIEREVERISEGTTYFTTPIFKYRFGVNEPEEITNEQLEELLSFLGIVEKAIQTRDWELFTSYVDEKSYIDFYILSELFKVVDIDYSSTRFYIKNGILYAGPPWDYDLSSGNADGEFYYTYNYHEGIGPNSSYIGLWCNVNFYQYCYEFPEFTDALRVRYKELQEVIKNLYEDNSLGINQIDLLLKKFGKSFDSNYTTAGWTLTKDFILERIPERNYKQNVEYLRGWLEKRNKFLLDSFK
jgi:hypothetical protein